MSSTPALLGFPIATTHRHKHKHKTKTTRPYWLPSEGQPLSCYPKYLLDEKPLWWGKQTIPSNKCYTKKKNKCKDWSAHKCWVRVGEVQLLYFPPAPTPAKHEPNETYFQTTSLVTMYDPVMQYTFTSPSIYILFHQITAWAGCKDHPNTQLGPVLRSAFFSFDLTDVSTLVPYKTKPTKGQTMSTKQLKLTDLAPEHGCTMSFNRKSAQANTAPRIGDKGYQCYPRLAIPYIVRDFAHPWWNGCYIYSRKDGMIDPPYALQPGTGIFPTTSANVDIPTTTDAMEFPAQTVSTVSVSIIETTIISRPVANENTGHIIPTLLPPGDKDTMTSPTSEKGNISLISLIGVEQLPDTSNVDPVPVTYISANRAPISGYKDGVVVYMSQTLTLGGELATVSSLEAVISYASPGVIVQLPNGTVYTVPVLHKTEFPTSTSLNSQSLTSNLSPTMTSSGSPPPGKDAIIASFINFVVNGNPVTSSSAVSSVLESGNSTSQSRDGEAPNATAPPVEFSADACSIRIGHYLAIVIISLLIIEGLSN
ncbi:hypothetical protein B0O99DRAFT_588848 [Bisporella sp. PMI_857]|nr:hypothetical protein B0O99DRAFT_588848 [Bisporella sp. PMI_857]